MKITDYERVNSVQDSDVLLIDGNRGTKTILVKDLHCGHTIVDEEGTELTQRRKLQFEGFKITDDSTNDKTKITSTNTTVAFTSNDLAANTTAKTSNTTNQPSTVAKLGSGETLASMFNKISSMFASVRKLWNTVGSTAIPSSLGNTVTGAISNLTPYFNWFGYNGSGNKTMTLLRAGYYYVYIHGSGDNGSSTMTLEIQINGIQAVYATGTQGGVIASAMHIIYATANSQLKFIFSPGGGSSGEVTDSNTMAWTQGGFIYLGSSH